MSLRDCETPECRDGDGRIDLKIEPRAKDLGGFEVRRVLPSPRRRAVGPFVFFDEMGPASFDPEKGIDVRPHPHIGLATITWLFEGQIMHRDSLGYKQPIEPGAINWMTAGRGIVHSERTAEEVRASRSHLHGIQAWVALPRGHEEIDPAFEHYPADTIPQKTEGGLTIHLIAGEAFGLKSPVTFLAPIFYAQVDMTADSRLFLPDTLGERAVYVVDGTVSIGGDRTRAQQMAILETGSDVSIHSEGSARLMVLGGAPLDGPRHMWWNFVHSDADRIEQAKADWKAGRFAMVPGDDEFIPLPDK